MNVSEILSGFFVGMACFSAHSATGEGTRESPRPRRVSGTVTISLGRNPALLSASSAYTAICDVPKNAKRISQFIQWQCTMRPSCQKWRPLSQAKKRSPSLACLCWGEANIGGAYVTASYLHFPCIVLSPYQCIESLQDDPSRVGRCAQEIPRCHA